jgi:Tfp pilus assembly protein PilX
MTTVPMTKTRMTMTRTVAALARRARGGDDGTALLLTLFTMLLVTTMSLTVGTAVLVQVRPTQLEQKSTRTVTAAEAGFDVALNRIRAAQDSSGVGIRGDLPCDKTDGTTFTGTVGAGTDASAYSVTIRYYTEDPSDKSEDWRKDNNNLVQCLGSGAPKDTPLYALLESSGSGAKLPGDTKVTGNRTLEQTYRFSVTNENIPGGQIQVNTQNLCLAAASHSNGAAVKVVKCDNDDDDILQRWVYTEQLLLQTTDASGNKYCIRADSRNNEPAVLTSTCDATRANQVWSFNDVGRFEGAEANGSGGWTGPTSDYCLTVQNDKTDGSIVHMKKECDGDYDSKHTFNPVAAVGAGAAGDATRQLVNYRFFGRCLDITNQNKNVDWLIGYPCKQAPSSTYVTWNQKFFWDSGTQQLCTNVTNAAVSACSPINSNLYCISAGSPGSTPSVAGRVLLKPCSATDTVQKWTRRFNTGNYATSYNIVTVSKGLCLELNPQGAGEASDYLKQWGLIQTATCDGSAQQKWNAPPNLEESNTDNLYEHSP